MSCHDTLINNLEQFINSLEMKLPVLKLTEGTELPKEKQLQKTPIHYK